MTVPDSFQTIAEISIAFAGFTGLIIALRKDAGPLTGVHKYRLQVLLSLAFGAMFVALLPDLLVNLAVDDAILWRVVAAALSVYSAIFVGWWMYRSSQIMKRYPEIFKATVYYRMVAGHLVVMVLLLSAVFSLDWAPQPGIVLVAMLWYLLHAAQQFTRMLFITPRQD